MDFGSKLNFTRNPINLKLRIESNMSNNTNFVFNVNYVLYDSCSPMKLNSIDKTIGFINKQYESQTVDLSNIYVLEGNITNINLTSDRDYNLYKLVGENIYNGIELDFTSIFYENDYFILENRTTNEKYNCQIYEIKNDSTIIFEELNGNDPTGLSGNIFNNITFSQRRMSIFYPS
jgi:hypothetical protein